LAPVVLIWLVVTVLPFDDPIAVWEMGAKGVLE
jgi:hypothetical protein